MEIKFSVFATDRQDMEWALNAMRQNENGFDNVPFVSDDMGIVKLRGLPYGCSKEEIVQFFDGKWQLWTLSIYYYLGVKIFGFWMVMLWQNAKLKLF